MKCMILGKRILAKKSSICTGVKLLKYQSRIKFELAAIVAAAAAYEEKEEEEDDKEGRQS